MDRFIVALGYALSLAMDALAVSISMGISVPGFKVRHGVKLGLYFGLFQFAMPVIGYFLGRSIASYIQAIDHYIALGLLGFIGIKMIIEALRAEDEEAGSGDPLKAKLLVILAVATSIDALVIGVTLAITGEPLWLNASVIGIVCFVLCLLGGTLGRHLGKAFGKWSGVAGGIVLIAIGIKTFLEHILG